MRGNHYHRTRGTPQDSLGYAAYEHTRKGAAAMSGYNNQINPFGLCPVNKHRVRLAWLHHLLHIQINLQVIQVSIYKLLKQPLVSVLNSNEQVFRFSSGGSNSHITSGG